MADTREKVQARRLYRRRSIRILARCRSKGFGAAKRVQGENGTNAELGAPRKSSTSRQTNTQHTRLRPSSDRHLRKKTRANNLSYLSYKLYTYHLLPFLVGMASGYDRALSGKLCSRRYHPLPNFDKSLGILP